MADAPALDLAFDAGPETSALCDLLYVTLDDFDPAGIQELETAGWRVFFRTREVRSAAAGALESLRGEHLRSITCVDIPDEGWARRSQAELTAVRIGRLTVAPPWDPAVSRRADEGDPIVIVIEPSMGFGTGHHPTTRLCLELLQAASLNGRRVIDAGTGSGLLAIAAAKLGAASVLAIDQDGDALQNARDNVERNGVSSIVTVREQDLSAMTGEDADVVVANLTGAALQQLARVLSRVTRTGGTLLVSGFAPEEFEAIERALGATAADARAQDGWAAACFTPLPTKT